MEQSEFINGSRIWEIAETINEKPELFVDVKIIYESYFCLGILK